MSIRDTRPVVVGIDGTPRSDGAIAYAAAEAGRLGAPLLLLHATPGVLAMAPLVPMMPVDLEPAGREVLARTAAAVAAEHPDLAVHTDLFTGSRVSGLVASVVDARLLVLGRETRHGMERMLTGATTAAVVARTACPVVVVDGGWRPPPVHRGSAGHRPPEVVVGIQDGLTSPDLLARAFEAAAERGAVLVALHAWHVPDAYADIVEARTHAADHEAAATELVEELLAGWRAGCPDVPVRVVAVHDRPAVALVAASQEADLLLVGRPAGVLPGHLGGTVRALLRAAACPVEVVPTPAVPGTTPDLVLEEHGLLAR